MRRLLSDPDSTPGACPLAHCVPFPSTRRTLAPAPILTGMPPNLLTVQEPGPVGLPCTAESRSPNNTGFRKAAMTTGCANEKKHYGNQEGALLCARALSRHERGSAPD